MQYLLIRSSDGSYQARPLCLAISLLPTVIPGAFLLMLPVTTSSKVSLATLLCAIYFRSRYPALLGSTLVSSAPSECSFLPSLLLGLTGPT